MTSPQDVLAFAKGLTLTWYSSFFWVGFIVFLIGVVLFLILYEADIVRSVKPLVGMAIISGIFLF